MISLTEAFLRHGAKAYPCGKVAESKKMLNQVPAFKEVKFVSPKTKLRSTLAKGTAPSKTNVAERG